MLRRGLLVFAAFMAPSAARSEGMSFDCDTPANHFSSITQPLAGTLQVSGVITPISNRSGSRDATVGAAVGTPGKKNWINAHLIPEGDHVFEVLIQTPSENGIAGSFNADGALPFQISVDAIGNAKVSFGPRTWARKIDPIAGANAVVYCSSGNFKLERVLFSSDGPSVPVH